MSFTFYDNSPDIWQAMYDSIAASRQSVCLEMFIFTDNIPEYDFTSLLIEKANEGVEVIVIVDRFASTTFSKAKIRQLRKSDVRLLFTYHPLYRMHKKILIVDEHEAFLGGANIDKMGIPWYELMIKITDAKLVLSLKKIFNEDCRVITKWPSIFAFSGDLDLAPEITNHSPRQRRFQLVSQYHSYFEKAQREIIIISPYFAPVWRLLKVMRKTVARGVRIKVLMSREADVWISGRASLYYMTIAAKFGVEIYLTDIMNHSKAMIIDRQEIVIGSQNFDFLSFELNDEVAVASRDPESVKELIRLADYWESVSHKFDPQTFRLLRWEYVVSIVLDVLVNVLLFPVWRKPTKT